MTYFHEALWIMPVLELAYEDLYLDYYYPQAGWEEVFSREVTPMHIGTEYDEKGQPREICYLRSGHIGSEWPRKERS